MGLININQSSVHLEGEYQSHNRNKATSKQVEEAADEDKEATIEQSQAQ